VSRLRNREIPARGAIITLLALSLMLTTPCWGAEGLADLAGPLRALALQGPGAGAAQQLGPLMGPAQAAGGRVMVVIELARSPPPPIGRSRSRVRSPLSKPTSVRSTSGLR